MRAVLALDQGSHASRACVFDADGALRASQQLAVGTQRDRHGHIEHRPDELLESLRIVSHRALQSVPELEVVAAGLATQRSTIVCFDRRNGAPLSPAISWQDRRHAAWLDTLADSAPRIRARTGLPLSPHYGASKLRWCLDRLPAVAAAAGDGRLCAAPLSSFLVAQLSGGTPLADPANASRTLLWDSATLDWSEELLWLFGLSRAWLPACAHTRADFGRLEFDGRPVPLRAVTGDQSAVPFAFGAPDPGCAYVNLGTGAFLQRPLTERPDDPAPLLGSIIASGMPAHWYSLEGTVNGAGSAVGEFIEQGGHDEAALWQALESLPDETPLPLFVNGVGGLGSPWWRAQQPTRFIGSGSAVQCLAAILESVVFMIGANFRLMRLRRPALTRVLISGGLSRSDWLCRRLAASLGVAVERAATEATVRGTAALAAPELAAQWPAAATARFEPRPLAGLAERETRLLSELNAG